MKKYFLLVSAILFFWIILPVNLYAQSFEIYRVGEYSYPTLLSANANLDEASGTVTITAEIKDISGVCSARATINSVVSDLPMQNPDPDNPDETVANTWVAAYTKTSGWSPGTYLVDISATDCLGNDSMTIGNDYINATSFDVAGDATSIDFVINPITVNQGESVSLTATLMSGGSGLGDKQIHFYDNSVEIPNSSGTTDSTTGVITYNYIVPAGATIGSHALKSSFAGDGSYSASDSPTQTLTVTAVWTCGNTFTDSRDSKTYTTVLIGTQCWMRQNINVGTLTAGANNQGTSCASIQKYCYSNLESNCATYGGLYQWNQAMCGSTTVGAQGICPADWHIPTHDEWTTLDRAVCTSATCATDFPYDTTTIGMRGTNEGTKLKSGGTSSFDGLIAGGREIDGLFSDISSYGYFWSSFHYSSDAWYHYLYSGAAMVGRYNAGKAFGFSVRCINNSSIQNPDKAITSFNFNALSPAVIGTITESNYTIALIVPYGTSVTALVPTITITGASVNPASGTPRNFENPQTYTVTAADSSTQNYIVTVTIAAPPTLIVSAVVSKNPISINETVTFSATPSGGTGYYTYIWAGACSGTSQTCSTSFPTAGDYTATVIVTSGTQTVPASAIVTVNTAPSSNKAITAFNFNALSPAVVGTITESNYTIALTVPFGTDLSSLTPTIVISAGATVFLPSGWTTFFNTPKTYTVTAADGSTQNYTVTVNVVVPSSAKAITSFNFNALSPAVIGTVTESNYTIALIVPYGTSVTALVPTITITGVSVSPASGAARNFTNSQLYTVFAADNSTQVYTVTVTVVAPPTLIVSATVSPNPATAGQMGIFSATVSGGTGTYFYSWVISGGGSCSNGSANQTCQAYFPTAGSYTAMVTVTSGTQTVPASVTVIANPLLTILTTVSPNPASPYQTVTFSATPSGGTGTYSYSWAGNCSGTSQTCTTSFSTAGSYTAMVTVTSGTQTVADSATVTVTASWTCGTNSLTDTRDSKIYTTVLIGSQCWMRQNINVGVRIDSLLSQGASCSLIQKYCYNNNELNCNAYGGLYQWNQTMCGSTTAGAQGICPTGWHIPTHDEFTTLERAVCTSGTCATDFPYNTTTTGWRGTNEGTNLKTIDSFHFSGLLAGYRGTNGYFDNLSSSAFFWSSVQSSSNAWDRLYSDYTTVNRNPDGKAYGFSVRCLKDTSLIVSATASPNPATAYQTVTFSATPSGGTGTYSYIWAGACSGASQTCQTSFSTAGSYTATVIVTSGTQTVPASATVTVQNSAKAITAFNFNTLSPAVIGTVTEGNRTIALTVPYGTNVTALVPTITITGASVSPASGTANNFTNPQTYTVTAVDNTTQAYTVTVTVSALLWTCGDNLIDTRDGRAYTTVLIGSQCWLAQNLNVGTRIGGGTTQGTSCSSIQKYCYSNTDSNCDTYGGLYQWYQAMCGSASCNGTGSGQPACTTPVVGICPTGWHIPSHYEWTQLELSVCTSGSCVTDFPYDTSTTGWRGTNESTRLQSGGSAGFNGLFAGYSDSGYFFNLHSRGLFWSSLQYFSLAWNRYLLLGNAQVGRFTDTKSYGFSVRCIKNP